jgi:hydrogenase maturation factor HypF (carbamoyltransferase family)
LRNVSTVVVLVDISIPYDRKVAVLHCINLCNVSTVAVLVDISIPYDRRVAVLHDISLCNVSTVVVFEYNNLDNVSMLALFSGE